MEPTIDTSGIIAARIGSGAPVPADRDAALSVRGLTVSYAEKPAVFSVDASFAAGAMTAIIGPNGAGKSTLLKACLGIVPRLSGEVDVFGQPVERARHKIAYVPQRASVDWDFPATVLDVVKMGLYRTTGLFGRLSRRHGYPCAGLPRPGRHGRFRGPPDRPALWRPTAARVPRPGAGAGCGALPSGRAFRRCRRRHGTRHRRCPEVAEGRGQDGDRRASRPRDRGGVFRPGFPSECPSVAEGTVAEAFTAEALSAAYGGRLAATHVDQLALSGSRA
jgi:manganese/zinc/iron transport system ATP- binding protein